MTAAPKPVPSWLARIAVEISRQESGAAVPRQEYLLDPERLLMEPMCVCEVLRQPTSAEDLPVPALDRDPASQVMEAIKNMPQPACQAWNQLPAPKTTQGQRWVKQIALRKLLGSYGAPGWNPLRSSSHTR